MKADYVHKDTLTATDYVELNKNNELLISYNQALLKENQELKKQLEEKQNPLKGIFAQVNDDTLLRNCGNMNAEINELKNQQKGFINYLEDEKDRLARECSNIYEDGLGHTRLVNEDIFDKINDVLQKYKEIIGGKNE